MRETPAAFAMRTSIAYAPPPDALVLGRRLSANEPCPTLFRYPGPCGLADWFAGSLRALAPGPLVWMSAATWCADAPGARFFGTLAVLQPLRLHPARVSRGIFAGAGDPPGEVVWLPPSLLAARLPWDQLADGAQAGALLRGATARERPAVIDELCRYLEELDLMRRSGAPGPGVPWLQLCDDERRRRLAAAGVRPVWTATWAVGKMRE
jgi:hypothetical protein